MRTYFVGLLKGSGRSGYHSNCHHKSTLVVQARTIIDNLSCELWKYYGERITTKKELHRNRFKILKAVNKQYGTSFKRVVID